MEKINKKEVINIVDQVFKNRQDVFNQTSTGIDTKDGHIDTDKSLKLFANFHSAWYKVWIKKFVFKAIKQANSYKELEIKLKLSVNLGAINQKEMAHDWQEWKKEIINEVLDELRKKNKI